MDRLYSLSHAPIPFYFRQSARDFVVEEQPLYPFSGEGEHLILHVRKKNLSTWEMVELLARHLGIKAKEIGYAGLKDKNAMTRQYISVHKSLEPKLESFSNENIKILEKTYHNNKVRMGHLKGNRFFIRLKKVTPVAAQMIDKVLKSIAEQGMPNYFGYQRFGNDGDNYKKGEQIASGKLKERNVKLKRMYVNAYQSHLFNLWLSRRLEISKLCEGFATKELTELLNMSAEAIEKLKAQPQPLKLLGGDVMMHYPHGKIFHFDGSAEDLQRYGERQIVPTGLLAGTRVKAAVDQAWTVEKNFDAPTGVDGARRYAWVYPEAIEGKYRENEAWYEIHFDLPKGSYATVLIEEIAKRDIATTQEDE